MKVKIRCGLCREAFPWELDSGYPETCRCCGGFIGVPPDAPEVAAPYISTAQKRGTADAVYRDMEQKSEMRAQLAAEAAGVSVAEMSHLKMTNMKDNLREGDTAQTNSLNPTQTQMDRQATFGSTAGLAAAQGTRTGPLPNAGTSFIHGKLRPNHQREYGAPVTSMTHIPKA